MCDSPLTKVDAATGDFVSKELNDVYVALKIIRPNSNGLFDNSIARLLPAVIMTGEFRGLEVTLCSRAGDLIIDSLDGTVAPLLKVSGLLIMHSQNNNYFFVAKAEDLLASLEVEEQ